VPKNNKKKNPPPKPTKASSTKLALFALGILLLLIIIGKLLTFLIQLQKPITPDLNTTKNYSWDKKAVINVAFIKNPQEQNPDISVLSFQPSEQKAAVLHLSASIYTDVPKNYGSWRLGSVFNLGNEESPKRGAELLKLTLSKLLGLPIDAIALLPDSTKYEKTENLIESFRKDVIPDLFYLSQIDSDLTKWEGFELFRALSKVRADKIDSLDFERSSITVSKLLPDTSRVLGINTVRLDLFIRDKLADPTILTENIPVAIFNATDQAGVAQEVARTVTNMGGNVIIIQNMDNHQQKSLIIQTPGQISDQTKKSVTYQRLSEFIAPQCLTKLCQLNDPKLTDSRATLNIVIGADYLKQWYEK
jgi:hypothetical protein